MTYRGNDSDGTGGHAFVLDGVQGTDYFHFNWGWSGSYNGYFYLDNLNPSYNFTYNQAAGIGIEPDIAQTYNPPLNLECQVNEDDVNLSWEAPGTSTQYVFDDNSVEAAWTINPNSIAWLGNKFPVTDSGILISIDIYSTDNPDVGTESVTIDIFDASQNLVGSSGSFVLPSDDWINVELPNVSFDDHFYVMVKWNDNAGETNFIGFDTDGPHAADNLDYYYNGTDWSLLHTVTNDDAGVFLIRANADVSSKGSVVYSSKNKYNSNFRTQNAGNILRKSTRVIGEAPILKNTKDLSGYRVFRDGSNISGLLSSSTLEYADENLSNDTYIYCVKAVYDSGVSDCSNEEEVTVNNSYDAPANLLAVVTNNDVDLNWNAPVVKTKALTGYRVLRDGTNISGLLSSSTLTYTDEDLANNSYLYCVKAVYEGGVSDCSNEEDITINHTYNAPTNLQGEVVDDDVSLSWTAAVDNSKDITGYQVFRNEIDISGTLSSATLTYNDLDLSDGWYDYCVKAVYSSGISDCSEELSILVGESSVNSHEKQVSIFPNPTQGILNIELLDESTYVIRLTDISGRTVLSRKETELKKHIDLTNLPKGIYILIIEMKSDVLIDKVILE